MSLNKIVVGDEPIAPSKVVCVGRNFVEHIEELNNEIPDEMVLFLKPNSSISSRLLVNSKTTEEAIHFETEICFIYSQQAFTSVGVGLDLTKRARQAKLKSKGLPWERAKAFKGAAVLSNFIKLNGAVSALNVKLWLNGKLQQSGSVAHMIFKPDAILDEAANAFSLQEGDVVMTGTPKGVGEVSVGDEFVVELFDAHNLLIKHRWIAEYE